jgi:hypothetical protein
MPDGGAARAWRLVKNFMLDEMESRRYLDHGEAISHK